MGLLTFIGRVVLVVMNIIFILVSLCLVAAGFVIRYAHEFLRDQVKGALDSLKAEVNNLYSGADFNTDNLDFGNLVEPLAIALIVVGLFLLAMSFVGCCGACCNFSTIMLVYAIVLIVLLVAQVFIVIVAFAAPSLLQTYLRQGLEESIKEYEGLKGMKLSSLTCNFVMKQYKCCGATDYTDFNKNKGTWKDNDDSGAGLSGELVTPVACCATSPASTSAISTCAGDTGDNNKNEVTKLVGSNYNKGCVEAIWQGVVHDNTTYFLTVCGICWLCQIVIIIFAILIFKDRGVSGGLV